MLFPTTGFVLFFALVVALNAAVFSRAGWRKALLLIASYSFYAVWDVRFLALMAGVSLTAWLGGLAVMRPGLRLWAKVGSITILIGFLAFFKYFNFFALSLQQLLQVVGLERDFVWLSVILPVGISFYVFQAISYVIDVDRNEILPRRNPIDIFLYISFFPQLVAGPIVRAAEFLPQLDVPKSPDAGIRAEAVVLILSGLFKKMFVANYISVLIVDPFYTLPDGQNTLTAIAAILGYGVQIYCDFSGYSDIAIGIALLLGYRFARNFNQPYRARSLREFWQRWHISLSTWIRDYLYIPLGGNSGGLFRQSCTLMLTMTLAGLWHGAASTFLVWGALHGAGLALERIWRWTSIVAVFVFVHVLWVPFRAPSFADTVQVFAALFRPEGYAPLPLSAFALSLIAIGLALNWLPLRWRDGVVRGVSILPSPLQAALLALSVFFLFAAAQDGVAPFIYFQF